MFEEETLKDSSFWSETIYFIDNTDRNDAFKLSELNFQKSVEAVQWKD